MRILTIILSLVCISAFAWVTPGEFAKIKEQAEKGDACAQCNLGACYAGGLGVSKDLVEAVKWYRKSAEQGDAVAQWLLGFCYRSGEGVLKDPVEAVKWFRKAAEQGYAPAHYYLGLCYYKGEGVLKDLVEAYAYYNLGGVTDEPSRRNRDLLEKEISPSQIEAGQKRSLELGAEIDSRKASKKKWWEFWR
jgi:uncharacterized protein